eukprot:TRINITY_DN6884_c0_g1_i2.p1 TRINITY_DN6884_c0_g1~~TRINITY_DN6884_c0_g1_i2.p1  ORF type:complete len:126 (+),score=8.13 TRINITY_DN6884_c0_g1_i2:53-430(+)
MGNSTSSVLINSIYKNDLETIQQCINSNPNLINEYIISRGCIRQEKLPLHFAIQNKNFKACKMLIENGSLINSESRPYPLTLAVKMNDIDICKLLLVSGADFSYLYFYLLGLHKLYSIMKFNNYI